MQVIIHTNETGNVSVTTPTGEISIEEVLAKDCPVGAIIVDDSTLPTEPIEQWRLDADGTITVVPAVVIIPTPPTASELMAQLNAIQAQNTALGVTA